MTEPLDAAEPEVRRSRGPALIWLIPIVAALVGGWLAYRTISEQGPKVVITFQTGEWLEAGKTRIKFRAVEVGTVTAIELAPAADHVIVHCEFEKSAAKQIGEGARFWVVRPRIGAGGISGLGTLMSGAWISMDPAPDGAKPAREFKGLETPPPVEAESPGLQIVLYSDRLRSLDAGSPVYYREIEVGSIYDNKLAKDGTRIELSVHIQPEYAHLVRKDSRFWNVGGIEVAGTITNLDVQMESLDALLRGGVAFDSPRGDAAVAAAGGAAYWLHESKPAIEETALRYGGLVLYLEADALGSISEGDRVFYREIPVGAVVSHELARDSRTVRVRLNIESRYASLVRSNSVFWNAGGISAQLGLHGLEIQTESMQAILAGGVAFATPDPPGHAVKSGSVFRMHPKHRDEWLAWSPVLWRGPPGTGPKPSDEKEGAVAKFFHYRKRSEAQAADDGEHHTDSAQETVERKHGFFHDLLHRGE